LNLHVKVGESIVIKIKMIMIIIKIKLLKVQIIWIVLSTKVVC